MSNESCDICGAHQLQTCDCETVGHKPQLADRIAQLEAENARLRAEVAKLNEGLDYAVGQLVTEADDLLRARLATAEAVCEAVNEFWDAARDGDTLPFKVVRALEKWREGKG